MGRGGIPVDHHHFLVIHCGIPLENKINESDLELWLPLSYIHFPDLSIPTLHKWIQIQFLCASMVRSNNG
jgi:hypothetical protein